MFKLIKKFLKFILLKSNYFYLKFSYRHIRGMLDEEMFLMNKLLTNKRRFIDIGANQGFYSYYFSKTFKKVEAFEPLHETINELKNLNISNINISHNGISNKNGTAKLNIPIINNNTETAQSSIEELNYPYIQKKIKVNTIDSYEFENVDLIKIDVEGHEEYVIQGSKKTILINKPYLLIEIEQRHIRKPINEIFSTILKLNYNGFFVINGAIISISDFQYEIYQKPYLNDFNNRKYINNFIFIPKI